MSRQRKSDEAVILDYFRDESDDKVGIMFNLVKSAMQLRTAPQKKTPKQRKISEVVKTAAASGSSEKVDAA